MRKIQYCCFLGIVIFLLACQNNSSNPADKPNSSFNIEKMYGQWQLVPSKPTGSRIDFETDGRILYKYKNVYGEPQAKALGFTLDSLGLRIHFKTDSKNKALSQQSNEGFIPLGYFLISEKKENYWPGVWQGEVVKLIRYSQNSPSILK